MEDSQIGQMFDGLESRGPDSQNYSNVSVNIGFGMTRLAINGIEEIQNQPRVNSENGDALVFNGEIYNFKELRAQLQSRGHVFKTDSDTEVIVHLYEDKGADAVHELNGMFGFALWDARRGALWIVRDRLGIKPIYFLR